MLIVMFQKVINTSLMIFSFRFEVEMVELSPPYLYVYFYWSLVHEQTAY